MRAISEGLDVDCVILREYTRRANIAIALALWLLGLLFGFLLGLLMSQTWEFECFFHLIYPLTQ